MLSCLADVLTISLILMVYFQVTEMSVYDHYKRFVLIFVEKSEELHLALFKSFERTLKNNPLLLKNILTLVTMFSPKTTNKEISKFCCYI